MTTGDPDRPTPNRPTPHGTGPDETASDETASDETASDETASDETASDEVDAAGDDTAGDDTDGTDSAGDGADAGDDASGSDEADGDASASGHRWWLRKDVLLGTAAVLAIVAVVSGIIAFRQGDDTQSAAKPNAASAANRFVAAATKGVSAVTSYDYRSLDIALQEGSAVTTGAYRRAFRAAITGTTGQRARSQQIVQSFEQNAIGIGTISTDLTNAKVLVFGTQSITRGDAAPVRRAVTLTATMVRTDGKYLISDLRAGTNAGVPDGNPQLARAAEAARVQTVDSLTLRRASLGADYAAAINGTVDPRRSRLVATLATARQAVARGDYDLTGRVTAIAIESAPSAQAVVVLVAATGFRVDNGTASAISDLRLRVTVVRPRDDWLVSDSQPVAG